MASPPTTHNHPLQANSEQLIEAETQTAATSPQQRAAPVKQRTKRNVRFLITEGGDVVSESVRFEKHGMPRDKATEALECLLAGNERFRKVRNIHMCCSSVPLCLQSLHRAVMNG